MEKLSEWVSTGESDASIPHDNYCYFNENELFLFFAFAQIHITLNLEYWNVWLVGFLLCLSVSLSQWCLSFFDWKSEWHKKRTSKETSFHHFHASLKILFGLLRADLQHQCTKHRLQWALVWLKFRNMASKQAELMIRTLSKRRQYTSEWRVKNGMEGDNVGWTCERELEQKEENLWSEKKNCMRARPRAIVCLFACVKRERW